MDAYVAKPVRLQQLIEAMDAVLPPEASEAA
jgi:hypothetical protein